MEWDQHREISNVAPGQGLLSTIVEDASIQASLQPWIAMEYYQLGQGRGRQLALMDCLDLGSQQIVRESQVAAVQKLGVTPSNLCTLSYCTPDPSFRFSEFGAGQADSVFFMPEHTEFDIYVPAGAQTAYITFDQQEFLQVARTLNPAQWERTPEQLQQLQSFQQPVLGAAINLWFSSLGGVHAPVDVPQMRRQLLHSILQIAVTPDPLEAKPSQLKRSRALHICRAARSYIDDRLAVDIVPGIADICSATGVCERTLQYAFRTYVDMSPLTYLRLYRLNRVRAVLQKSDAESTTVTAVAMRLGFLHLGRFALDYRQLFGESPSVTLAS